MFHVEHFQNNSLQIYFCIAMIARRLRFRGVVFSHLDLPRQPGYTRAAAFSVSS
jgi:hypothetical protein